MSHTATVLLSFDLDDEQLQRARERAAELDQGNLGTTDPPEWYTPSLALARILASDDEVVGQLIPAYTDGYTAQPREAS